MRFAHLRPYVGLFRELRSRKRTVFCEEGPNGQFRVVLVAPLATRSLRSLARFRRTPAGQVLTDLATWSQVLVKIWSGLIRSSQYDQVWSGLVKFDQVLARPDQTWPKPTRELVGFWSGPDLTKIWRFWSGQQSLADSGESAKVLTAPGAPALRLVHRGLGGSGKPSHPPRPSVPDELSGTLARPKGRA